MKRKIKILFFEEKKKKRNAALIVNKYYLHFENRKRFMYFANTLKENNKKNLTHTHTHKLSM
jgi:hypothetical protein